jgi:hypothetical protein
MSTPSGAILSARPPAPDDRMPARGELPAIARTIPIQCSASRCVDGRRGD